MRFFFNHEFIVGVTDKICLGYFRMKRPLIASFQPRDKRPYTSYFLLKICIKGEFVFQPQGTVLFLSTSLAKVNAENKQL